MKRAYNDIEDFLLDEAFRNWVLNPTPELRSQWTNWLEDNPDKKPLVVQARQLVSSLQFEQYQVNTDRKEQILNNIKTATPDWNETKTISIWSYWTRVAAVILIAFGLGFVAHELTQPQSKIVADHNLVFKENPYGVRSHYLLSDGTDVYLNAGSSIEFPKNFSGTERKVILKGEAYFEVKTDKNRPFKVISDDFSVTVLGTKFNFNTETDRNAVALLEGKVQYESATGASVILKPGQLSSFNKDKGTFELSDFDEEVIVGWKNGLLIFRDATLEEVQSKLEKWYGVSLSIDIAGKSPDWSYTARFSNESLETVLLNMSTVKNFMYEINGKNVHLEFQD